MRTRGPLTVGLCLALMVALGGCDRETACGELQYDPATELCVCPEGTYFDEENGRCLSSDGGASIDGGARDASVDAQVVDARAGEDSCALTTLHRDADGDGFGRTDMTTEACGPIEGWVADATDCDDECSACAPGAREICDGLDNDCDRVADDGLPVLTYYADCDADGFAATGAAYVSDCGEPSAPPPSCAQGMWTTRAPSVGQADCADQVPQAFPGQTMFFTSRIAGFPVNADFDYDCDGVETRASTRLGSLCLGTNHPNCQYAEYWHDSDPVPECGSTGSWQTCPSGVFGRTDACGAPRIEERIQGCR